MTAPTPAFRNRTANGTGASKNVASVACTAGQPVIVKAVGEDGQVTFTTAPTGLTGSPTWNSIQVGTAGSSGRETLWYALATNTETVTVTLARGGANSRWLMEVITYTGSDGFGNTWSGEITSGSGAPSVGSVSTTQANSAIECVGTDWNANGVGSPTVYRTADAGTATEDAAVDDGNNYTYFFWHHADAGAAATKTLGISSPSSMRWGLAGLEIKGTAGGGTDQTVVAPAADGTGDIPTPAVSADANVTIPPAAGAGDLPAAAMDLSAEVNTGPLSGTGALPAPAASGTGSATVTSPAADGTGDIPAPTVNADATVTAPGADGAGDLPTPAVTTPGPRLRRGDVATGGVEVSARLTGGIEAAHTTGGVEAAHTTGGEDVFTPTGGVEVALATEMP